MGELLARRHPFEDLIGQAVINRLLGVEPLVPVAVLLDPVDAPAGSRGNDVVERLSKADDLGRLD